MTGRSVLFLHGAAFSRQTWAELGSLEALARAGHRAVAIDLPGYGDSAPSSADPVEFLGSLLTALSMARPMLVSPSMSGRFSLPFVAAHPERLSAFVPIAPAGVDSFKEQLSGTRIPALVLWGSEDTIFPAAGAEQLARLLPDARVVLFEGASHPCYLDDPGRFHSLLLELLGP